MPKMRTHKSSKRRVRVTRKGKVVMTTAGVRHLMADRTPKTKRNRRAKHVSTSKGIVKRAKYMISH
jgi:large subunit ribosomal protein L35